MVKKFGAFIMTYERPDILWSTIRRIQEQTLPPSYILVVDNSISNRTEKLMDECKTEDLGYYRVGYNSGPAGAAKIGLERLTEMGFEWVYWGDDDDPPVNSHIFLSLFEQLDKVGGSRNVGIFGSKGGRLSKTGRIKTFSNTQLQRNEFLNVDMIPGGGNLLVNSLVVKRGVLPKERLFFGFEELDFCLEAKNRGFDIVISTREWLEENYKKGYTREGFRWKDSFFGKKEFLWRGYYSTRNLLYIFFIHKYFLAFGILFLKAIAKSVFGFKFGVSYGWDNFTIQWKALWDLISGNFGPNSDRRNS